MKVFFFFLALCGIGFAVSVADQEDSKARLSLSNDPFFGSIFRKIKGFFTGNKTPKTPNRNTSNGKHKGCLYAQNVFRRLHRNTPDMVWDANLASQAQSWAEHLLNLGYMKHAKVRGQGENIYTQTSSWGPATCAQAAHAWYEEIKNPGYNFNNVGGSFSGTGHFTQLVWDTSVRTGVGIASRTRNGKTKTFIVARYAPQGNFYMRGRKVEAPDNTAMKTIFVEPICLFALLSLIIIVMTTRVRCDDLSSIIDQIDSRETREFVRSHCYESELMSSDLVSTAPSDTFRLRCRNIESGSLMLTRCHSDCFNPIKCRKMIMFHNRPIYEHRMLRDDEGNETPLHLPIACHCLPKNLARANHCLSKHSFA